MDIYKIEITLQRQEEVVTDRAWELIRSAEDAERLTREKLQEKAQAEGLDDPIHLDHRDREDCKVSRYGHTPQVIEVKKIKRMIYSQEVTDLDIKAVIDAINTPVPPTLRDTV